MPKRKLRIGMIGAGGISEIHCEGWTKLPDCDLLAIADTNLAAAQRRAEQFGIDAVGSSGNRLIGRKDIDVVDIVTPNRFHRAYTVAALRAGKHVLCEKPLALSGRDVDAMIAASQKAGRKLMCAQHMRFEPEAIALKEYIRKHPLGQIYYARAWYNRRRGLPTTKGFLLNSNSGGGCCIDVGVHVLDLAMHLMDNFEPICVAGIAVTKLAKRAESWSVWDWGYYNKRRIDVEDFAAGTIRFANGAVLSLECSFMLNQGPQVERRIDLFGTKAGAKWPECEHYDHTTSGFVDTKINVRQAKQRAHHAQIRSFAEAVMGDTPVFIPPQQSRAVIAILEGLYKSAERGKEVKL